MWSRPGWVLGWVAPTAKPAKKQSAKKTAAKKSNSGKPAAKKPAAKKSTKASAEVPEPPGDNAS